MAKVEVIYQFEKGTWVENIVVRASGNLLVTLLNRPEVWEIDPSVNPATGHLVHRFPDAFECTGIIETKPNHFAIAVGSNPFLGVIVRNWAIAEINMELDPPAVRIVTDQMVSARLLNGMTRLNDNTVLIADSWKGIVWHVDLESGLYKAVTNQERQIKPNPALGFGINGIRIYGDSIWVSNTYKGGFGKIPFDMQAGSFGGSGETFAKDLRLTDDFAISPDENTLYACNHWENGLIKVDVSGSKKREIIAGGPTSGVMLGPTSVVFGRTDGFENTLYLSTAGKSMLPLFKNRPDSVPEGGRIVKVTLQSLN